MIKRFLLVLSLTVASGCAGTKLLRHPVSMPEAGAPLASVSDRQVDLALDWVIVRDGPGTWARNADWDEYLLSIRNRTSEAVTIIDVQIIDSGGTAVATGQNRAGLVNASKATARRYRDDGIEVRAGIGGATLAAAGGASYLAGSALGVAVLTGSAGTGAAGVAVGAIAAAPLLAAAGIVRGINNDRVNRRLIERQTALPSEVAAGMRRQLNLFFPIAPSPRSIRVTYHRTGHAQETIELQNPQALAGLHLPPKRQPAR